MPWSDVLSSLPPSVKVPLAVFTIVPAVAVVSYIALVVTPTVPAVVEAIKQGRSATQGAMNRRAEFMQSPSEKTEAMHFSTGSIWQQLDNDVQYQTNSRDKIANQLDKRVESAIYYLNRSRDYRLDLDRP